MAIKLIAAMSVEGVIGDGEKMLWDLPEDLKHFRKTTKFGTVIMGRKTFESLKGPLDNRVNIVLTRNPPSGENNVEDGVIYVKSLEEAFEEAALLSNSPDVFIIGGGDLYHQTIDMADELIISHVGISVEGSVKFPPIDRSKFRTINTEYYRDAKIPFTVLTYKR